MVTEMEGHYRFGCREDRTEVKYILGTKNMPGLS